MTKLTKEKVRKAIPGSMGIYTVIASKCNVDRSTITLFLQKKENQNILQEINEEREKLIDIGERKLLKLIDEDNFHAIKLLLTTKGKNRGWIERQEIESKIQLEPSIDIAKLLKATKHGKSYH